MVTFITGCIALVLAVYWTILYARDLKKGRDTFLKKTGRWLKEITDALFGIQ